MPSPASPALTYARRVSLASVASLSLMCAPLSALAPAGATEPSTPALAQPVVAGSFALQFSDPMPGEQVAVTGTLGGVNPTTGAAVQRAIFLQYPKAGAWRTISRGRVSKKGQIKLVAAFPRTGTERSYRVYSPQQIIKNVTYPALLLPPQTFQITKPSLTLSNVPTTASLGQGVALNATVSNVRPTRSVALQVQKGRLWRTVSSFKYTPIKTGQIGPDGKPLTTLPTEARLLVPTKLDATMNMRVAAAAFKSSTTVYSELFQIKVGAGTPTPGDSDSDGATDAVENAAGTNSSKIDTDGDGILDGVETTSVEAGGTGTDPTKKDSDGDGIDDNVELDLKTNPTVADTDGDGLSDGVELTRGTDPTKKDIDTDADGLFDAEELAIGSNPKVSDSDGDGINDGAEVQAGTDPLTTPVATDSDSDGISDADETAAGSDPNNADSDSDGIPDGTEASQGTSPSNPDTDGDGALDGTELAYGTSPSNPDTDGDGVNDGDEINVFASSPVDTDSDDDGLSDGQEVTLGTSLLVVDTDSDGLSDAAEVNTHTTDPTVADTDTDGLNDGAEVTTHTTDPKNPDTDADTLTDGDEVTRTTNPKASDSDGDTLSDGAEVNTFTTNPKATDTDGDTVGDVAEAGPDTSGPLGVDLDPKAPYSWAAPSNKATLAASNPYKVSDGVYLAETDSDTEGLKDYREVLEGTSKSAADTDGEGVNDFAEVVTYTTNPLAQDTDSDGVKDNVEVGAAGVGPDNIDLDPKSAYSWAAPSNKVTAATAAGVKDGAYVAGTDTDAEGLKDYREVLAGTDKTKSDTDGDTLTDNAEVDTHTTNPLNVDTDGDFVEDNEELSRYTTDPKSAASKPAMWDFVDGGGFHRCAVKTDGTLWCWGKNANGQIGVGDLSNAKSPRKVLNLTGVIDVAASSLSHTCAIVATNNNLYCWGEAARGAVGNGTSGTLAADVTTPALISGGWAEVETGGDYTCGIKTNGTLWCWGLRSSVQGDRGALESEFIDTPTQMGTATNWKVGALSLANNNTCGLKTNGTLWCWGYNVNGELGMPSNGPVNSPTQVGTATNWRQVAEGNIAGCGVKTDDTLWCWGNNEFGTWGTGTQESNAVTVPTQVGSGWSSVAHSFIEHMCGTKTNGSFYCWGTNSNGQILGQPVGAFIGTPTPVSFSSLANAMGTQTVPVGRITGHGTGFRNECVITNQKRMYCYGENTYAAIGNGASGANVTTPFMVRY